MIYFILGATIPSIACVVFLRSGMKWKSLFEQQRAAFIVLSRMTQGGRK